jgi:hypothetical protein
MSDPEKSRDPQPPERDLPYGLKETKKPPAATHTTQAPSAMPPATPHQQHPTKQPSGAIYQQQPQLSQPVIQPPER